ncbi:SubName: Full=Uncharacterized protein {ECO:0000313/EMBL:CCA67886.1} [Serendipita indica DSM 11827]|uniref:Tetratricopeptide SHNi-TPR domain-containing protein n=1 Tax=Serendipita indica (strain DSM 11827) TaxID=1109443 RepID=G4T973_SERID|nr:SubName: Full=Uncharacterized protein {ECO:0000313/EMBL:CCA67886.1} [Serendipita indica DSM 11827]CCA67886.1 hypothetical protein PIIN_01707 [Serendipita indica DSM 11827]
MSTTVKEENEKTDVPDLETLIGKAKRAFALKQYEQAVTTYATALENYANDCTPATVDIYYLYGCALLENAIISNNVLGNKQEEEEEPEEPEPKTEESTKGRFFFGADGAEGEEDAAVDLFAQAEAAEKEEEKEKDEGDAEEPEDDFEAAWDILELAKTTYDTMQGDESQLKLAATYMALGDISLETEKFDQAILDYKSALDIKSKLFPISNRQIADAHFRLSLAYDMTSGKLENQIEHVEKALESVKSRINVLNELLPKAPESKATVETDAKGKGKATTVQENPLGWTPKFESLESMTKSEIEAEIKDVKSLAEELEAKLEDIRATPADGVGGTTMDRVGRELDKELNASGFGAPLAPDQPVNDLTSMVKKKKPKPAPGQPAPGVNPLVPDAKAFNPLVPDAKPFNPLVPDSGSLPSLGKRKAEEDGDRDEKKQRVE